MTSVAYNTSGASGVAATSTVTYNYDNVNGSETKGLLLSIAVAGSYSESYAYDSNKRVSSVTRSMDGRNYTTGFQYNTANQQTQMTYPSGRVINFGHDNKGRLTSAGSFLSSVTYNGISQLTGTTLGNGVTESYGYDANRMQLTSQTATKSGGSANGLMNLTYGYQASAGQMGAGSTAGNAGQLMTISGTMGAIPCKGCPDTTTTETASYTYDVVGRLVTSNQASNGSLAQRRFAYDRWGNRTGMWDAVSGGNQIQNVVLQQSGGAPTNRLTSVTTSGLTANYSYDASGNVTNDGVHAYTFDAENRIVSVDSGTTATYAYDASNRRFKKVSGGATTHYIWQASQVIAEHNGSTGAVVTDYAYFGSRMIANVSGGNTQYLLSDPLSVRVALDGSGNVSGRQTHLPFGEDFGETGAQEKHHFTSYERDASNSLDYAINRWYSANVGRFVSADAYKSSGCVQDPRGWNRYSYTRNVLTNRVDPLGLDDVGANSCYVFLGVVICPGLGGSMDVNAGPDGLAAIGIGGNLSRPPPNLDGKGNGVGGVRADNGCRVTGGTGNDDANGSEATRRSGVAVKASDEGSKVYVCARPLKSGPPQMPVGPLQGAAHQYLCVSNNDGTFTCIGLSPSGSVFGSPGRNEPSDGYDPKKCHELSSDPCFVDCVKRKMKEFGEHPPDYDYPSSTCQTWVSDTSRGCKKECKK
jgi:RHS repeat-associated protein